MKPQEMLSTHETANELKVAEDTVRRWLREGILPGIKLPNRAGWRIRRSDLDAWLSQEVAAYYKRLEPTAQSGGDANVG